MQLLPSYNEEYKEWEAKPNIVFASDGKAYPIKEFFTAENFPEVALAVKTITDEINTLVDVARGKAEEAIVGVQTANSTLQTGTTEWYTLDGKRTSSTAKGIKIMRMSDGTVKKVVTR